ncbi:MAG: PD-(D/E)XK nuclease family protein [Halanaerobiales bacterium]
MHRLKQVMKDINRQYLFDEKILIVPSYTRGRQLLHSLTESGINILNLHLKTINQLAVELYEKNHFGQNKELIASDTGRLLTYNILKNLKSSEQLVYFNELQITAGISKAIYNTLLELRMADFTSNLDTDAFIAKEKAEDIQKIMELYQEELKKKSYLDRADIYRLLLNTFKEPISKEATSKEFNQDPGSIYIIPSNLEVNYLQEQFLNLILDNYKQDNNEQNNYKQDSNEQKNNNTDKQYIILPLEEVPGLQKPETYYISKNYQAEKYMDYLYDIDNCPEELDSPYIRIKKAYGESNEVKEILRELKREDIPFDRAVVFCTVSEPYNQLFYDIHIGDSLPITFGDGIGIRNTAPGKLYFSLLQWIEEGYSDKILREILLSGCFKYNDGLYPSQLAGAIRKIAIGRGRERYFDVLKRELEEYEQASYQYQELKIVLKFIESIFASLPAEDKDGLINAGELINGLVELIKNHSMVSGDLDAEARKVIIETLEGAALFFTDHEVKEIILFLTDLINGARVGVSSPKPGHLHIVSYHRGSHIGRRHNFIIGLDSAKFPGQGLEDPVLLDVERKQLGRLSLKRDRQKEENYQLAGLLNELKGNITLSYPCFDTIENRENTPAALLLQVYRLINGKSDADYTELIKSLDDTAEFIPYQESDLLDEAEYWLYIMLREAGIRASYSLMLEIYKHIEQGLTAVIARQQNFNEYNGKIALVSNEIDPRENGDILSVSRLEQIGKCPYCYFMKYILGIKPPDEMEYDPGSWLDPLMRGSLLHEIYEVFYKEINSRGEKPSLRKHIDLIYQIAEEKLNNTKEEIQPPSEIVYQIERNEIIQSCQVFLASEEDNAGKTKPAYFELAFGFGSEESDTEDIDEDRYQEEDMETGPPVEIDLGNGKSIKLRGRIDRVDQVDEKTYNIIDYKTGSTYGFFQQNYFREGRQLQHALYALALEEIFNKDISVNLAGYIFPSLKGEGQRFMRPQKNNTGSREDIIKIVNILLDLISKGTMVMTNDKGECKFCDYRVICDPENMIALIEKMRKDPDIEEFDTIRRLADFE